MYGREVWRAWALLLLTSCTPDDRLEYRWDDRNVLCSLSFDDLSSHVDPTLVDDQISHASETSAVALAHAHAPGTTVSVAHVEHVLDESTRHGLDFVTFRELVPGPPRAAIAIAFDDSNVESWASMQPMLEMYGAHVTFFVSRYDTFTPENKALLHQLADAGHDIEVHTVNHLNAVDYAAAHGVAAYIDDEVLPSIAALAADGYAPTSFSFPFGASNDALDAAVLEHLERVRVSPGSCPY